MTGPVTTEALAFRDDLVRAISNGSFGKHYEAADAFMASHVAPLLAALQQVTAERDEARAEYEHGLQHRNDLYDTVLSLRTSLAAAKSREDTATSELARLRAEGEALRAALKVFAAMSAMDPPESVPLNEWLPAITGARAALNDRTALARAATAREGDTPTTEDKGREDRA